MVRDHVGRTQVAKHVERDSACFGWAAAARREAPSIDWDGRATARADLSRAPCLEEPHMGDVPPSALPGRPRPRRLLGMVLALMMLLAVLLPTGVGAAQPGPARLMPVVRADDWGVTASVPRSGVAEAVGPPYLVSVSAGGRHFNDQYGKPVLVKGDSPWSLMSRLSPQEAERYFANRAGRGYNAAIVSLVGSTANGGPSDDGATFDGLTPFASGDILQWNQPYWQRMHDYVRLAAAHGITLLLYPIDGWNLDKAVAPTSPDQCYAYGVRLATHFRDLPNIVWMAGGDYFPDNSTGEVGDRVDTCMDLVRRGVRSTGDSRPFSIQLGYPKELSTDDPFWAQRVDWNFVYTYSPTYRDVRRAYELAPARPAVLAESNYEGENNDAGSKPTTNETLRRQILWALTSGSAGDIAGSRDWTFGSGWEQRLDSDGVRQIVLVRRLAESVPWWDLVPDSQLIVAGAGTFLPEHSEVDVLDNDYATAARTTDSRLAVIYVPAPRTLTIDSARLSSRLQAAWVDPSTGEQSEAGVGPDFTPPDRNAAGDGDWLLVLKAA